MDIIFNLFKVKFSILDHILSKDTNITPTDKINVFINLEPVIRKLMASNIDNQLKVSDIYLQDFASNILNLAAHYRLFFSKNKLYSRIFLYVPSVHPNPVNGSLVTDYRQSYYDMLTKKQKNKHFGKLLEDSADIIKIITEYIEGVYYIESGAIENSLVPYIVNRHLNDGFKNIIVSSDRYDFQYVNYGFDVIVPKKEESHVVNKENIITRFKIKEKVVDDSIIDPSLYSFLLSILGDKRRDIPKISRMGLISIIKAINKAKEKGIVTDKVNNINILTNIVKDESKPMLLNNFYVTDVLSQFKVLSQLDIFFITKQLKDKFDNESLKKVNDIYFEDAPISLLELCSGTKFKEVKKIF